MVISHRARIRRQELGDEDVRRGSLRDRWADSQEDQEQPQQKNLIRGQPTHRDILATSPGVEGLEFRPLATDDGSEANGPLVEN